MMSAALDQFDGTARTVHLYRFGPFEFATKTGELRRNALRVRLQEQPRRILNLLVEQAGELVTREELRKSLWDADTFVDFDIGLNTAIGKLRHALGERLRHPQYIETLPRKGYRFLAPVAVFAVESSRNPSQLFPAGEWLETLAAAEKRNPEPPVFAHAAVPLRRASDRLADAAAHWPQSRVSSLPTES